MSDTLPVHVTVVIPTRNEEAAIVDGMGSMSSFSSKAIKNLIKLATHLDKKGLIKEATYIDILLRKNAGMFHSLEAAKRTLAPPQTQVK